jgi:hypothetical protein
MTAISNCELVDKAYGNNPRNGSWTSVSVRFCGFLPRRDDDDADCILLGEATTAGSRKNGQSRL